MTSSKKELTYDELIKHIETNTTKMNSSEIGLDEAMKLFEQTLEYINQAQLKLDAYKGQIKKVLANNQVEDFTPTNS